MRTTTLAILSLMLMAAPETVAQDPSAAIVRKQLAEPAVRTFEFVGGQLVGGDPVKGAPYSAEAVTETTQTLADGNRIVRRSSSVLYRDSEGRERREESFNKLGNWSAEGEPAKAIFISDPVAKVNYTLDTKGRTAHKLPLPAMVSMPGGRGARTSIHTFTTSAERMPPPPPPLEAGAVASGNIGYSDNRVGAQRSPAKVEQLGKNVIEGVEVEGTRTIFTIPAGQIGNERPLDIISERWYSPELKVTVLSKNSDPRSGETVYKLTNINRSEPLRSMFEVPPDYTIEAGPMMRLRTLPAKQEQQ